MEEGKLARMASRTRECQDEVINAVGKKDR